MYDYLNTFIGFSIFLFLSFILLNGIVRFFTDPCSLRGADPTLCSRHFSQSNLISNHPLPKYSYYEPIDVVYTWVNGSDPVWLKKKEIWTKNHFFETLSNLSTLEINTTIDNPFLNSNESFSLSANESEDDTMSHNRYRDSGELRYSLRSIVKNAPWIRRIFLVTDNQIPAWLNLETEKLTVVTHEDIFPNKSHLPVFSSPAIETHLHRIPGLSKKFIYFNDDVFLGAPVYPEDFVNLRGEQQFYMAWEVPKCAPGCSDSWIGDGFCDKACNVSACNFDFPDCVNGTGYFNRKGGANGRGVSTTCSKGCPDNWLGDRVCDQRCKNEECGWDVGDCGLNPVKSSYPGIVVPRSAVQVVERGSIVSEVNSDPGVKNDTQQLNNSYSTVSQSTAVLNLNVSSNSSHSSEVVHSSEVESYPIPKGVSAFYIDLSILPCQFSPNSTCTPRNVTGFKYVSAHHNDEENQLVHTATLLKKHSVLVVTLYHGQEGAPTAPPGTFNVTFRIVGEYKDEREVVFNISSVVDVRFFDGTDGLELETPQDMGLIEESMAASCCVSKNQSCLGFNDLSVQKIPFSSEIKTPTPQSDNDSNVEDDFNQDMRTITEVQGAIVELKIDSHPTDANRTSFEGSFDNLFVKFTTTRTGADVRISISPITEVLLIFNRDFSQFRPFTESRLFSWENYSFPDFLEFSTRSSQPYRDVQSIKQSYEVKDPDPHQGRVISRDNRLYHFLYLLIPSPQLWGKVNNDWTHTKVELLEIRPKHEENCTVVDKLQLKYTEKIEKYQMQLWRQRMSSDYTEVEFTAEQPPLLFSTHRWVSPQQPEENFYSSQQYSTDDYFRGHTTPTAAPKAKRNGSEEFYYRGEGDSEGKCVLFEVQERKLCLTVLMKWGADLHLEDDFYRGSDFFQPDSDVETEVEKHLEVEEISSNNSSNSSLNSTESKLSIEQNNQTVSREHMKDKIENEASSFQEKGNKSIEVDTFNNKSTVVRRLSDLSATNKKSANILNQLINETFSFFSWYSDLFISNFNSLYSTLSTLVETHDNHRQDHHHRRRKRRRLMDTYASSLIFVNRLYSARFGTEMRKVPSHLPHMIDRDVMEELQTVWPGEWNATSAHRFRSPTDMQYSFAYYHYLFNRRKVQTPDLRRYFSAVVDTDNNGIVSENEMRTLVAIMVGDGPSEKDMEEVLQCIENNSTYVSVHNETNTMTTSVGEVSKSFRIRLNPTVEEVLNCSQVTDKLIKNADWTEFSPTAKMMPGKDLVAFEMIGDNLTLTRGQLDSVRARQSKFICINDNMHNPSEELQEVLKQFFESFYPTPSVFELPEGRRNPTLYWDEYKELRKSFLHKMASKIYKDRNIWGIINNIQYLAIRVVNDILDLIVISLHDPQIAEREYYINGLRREILRNPTIYKSFQPPSTTEIQKTKTLEDYSRVVLAFSLFALTMLVLIRIWFRRRRRVNEVLNSYHMGSEWEKNKTEWEELGIKEDQILRRDSFSGIEEDMISSGSQGERGYSSASSGKFSSNSDKNTKTKGILKSSKIISSSPSKKSKHVLKGKNPGKAVHWNQEVLVGSAADYGPNGRKGYKPYRGFGFRFLRAIGEVTDFVQEALAVEDD